MNKLLLACAPLLALAAASPALSQGATQTPPAPSSSASGPTPPNSVPSGAMTMAPDTQMRAGTLGTARVGTQPRRRRRQTHTQ